MHDGGGKVIHGGPSVGASRLVQVVQEVAGHVEAVQRKLDMRVNLCPRVRAPAESLYV